MRQPLSLRRCKGTILLYVLWILVVITSLAFNATNISRASMVSKSAQTSQIKTQLQLRSAVQFAKFKIIANEWLDRTFELELNGSKVLVEIVNESGFLSVYRIENPSLLNLLESRAVPEETQAALKGLLDSKIRFNDVHELKRMEGMTPELWGELLPYISIYHEDDINPMMARSATLKELAGVDQYRVEKLLESGDVDVRRDLRQQLNDVLTARDEGVSDSLSGYYRVNVTIDQKLYRQFVRFDPRNQQFVMVGAIDPLQTRD